MKKRLVNFLSAATLLGCRTLGLYNLWNLFHRMRIKNPQFMQSALEYMLNAELPGRPLGPSFEATYFSPQSAGTSVPFDIHIPDASFMRTLNEIPSEASVAEKKFLYRFFASTWSGRGVVFEIGPFLGGTSRAIAMGMQENPRCSDGAMLRTYDRFSDYHGEGLESILKPLFDSGVLTEAQRHDIVDSGSFMKAYQEIHKSHAYSKLICPLNEVLPDTPEELDTLENVFHTSVSDTCDAVFIDGAKSWFGTRHAMIEFSKITKPGAYYIFQDYGWYTCFWLPSFIGAMAGTFRLIWYVDNTYVFQQVADMNEKEIAAAYPAQAEQVPVEMFERLFEGMSKEAKERGDRRGAITYRIQLAAAWAYIGLQDEARNLLDKLANQPEAAPYLGLVTDARKSPTYYPKSKGGPIYL